MPSTEEFKDISIAEKDQSDTRHHKSHPKKQKPNPI
jgi:hypothetical protein